jgi:competence protein ComEA
LLDPRVKKCIEDEGIILTTWRELKQRRDKVGASGTARATQKVDLNAATMAELMTLPNIGQKRAEEIVRYRLTHGFKRPADLLRIKGIGRRTYFKLKPLVRVGPLPASRAREIEAVPAEAP